MRFTGLHRMGLFALLVLGIHLLGGPLAGLAQETPQPPASFPPTGSPTETLPKGPLDEAPEATELGRVEILDAWSDAWSPGEAHTRLAARVGVWKLTTRTWGDPAEEPVVTETTAVREMILGGRCLQERVMGEVQGFPFESLGHLGYDNVTGRWWSTWMDTLSTAVVVTTGTRDPRAREIVLTGEYADPLTGESRRVRSVHRWLNLDTERFEWWETRDSVEVKTMEILYQRQTLDNLR